jgi:phage recombination protein Bet
MSESNQANKDALGDLDAPGTITNAGVYDENKTLQPLIKPGEITRVEVPRLDEKKIALIKAKVAGNCTDTEFELLLYMADKYKLDPLLRQIWAVKFGDRPAQIYAGRDGFLEIAHRSGHFDGMQTVVNYSSDGKTIESATCTVWRNDMTHPFVANVLFKEYNTGKNLWLDKPAVMIGKVAESVCLRKAFSVSGLYSPEEMG